MPSLPIPTGYDDVSCQGDADVLCVAGHVAPWPQPVARPAFETKRDQIGTLSLCVVEYHKGVQNPFVEGC